MSEKYVWSTVWVLQVSLMTRQGASQVMFENLLISSKTRKNSSFHHFWGSKQQNVASGKWVLMEKGSFFWVILGSLVKLSCRHRFFTIRLDTRNYFFRRYTRKWSKTRVIWSPIIVLLTLHTKNVVFQAYWSGVLKPRCGKLPVY